MARYMIGVFDRAGAAGEFPAADAPRAAAVAAVLRVTRPGCVVAIFDGERDGRAVDECSEDWLDATEG